MIEALIAWTPEGEQIFHRDADGVKKLTSSLKMREDDLCGPTGCSARLPE